MTVEHQTLSSSTTAGETSSLVIPPQSYGQLFRRFLRFGLLAWGGPVAQIAMIRHELVDEERWISNERFNRTLAIYQVLPGPEAHELCVFFGYLARGRLGGLLAGLGFMLPGFVLMLALSWFYVRYGIVNPLFQSIFLGFQAAVVALIARAVHRIGGHALYDRWLLGTAAVALVAALLSVHFVITLLAAGLAYLLVKRNLRLWALMIGSLFLIGVSVYAFSGWAGSTELVFAQDNPTPGIASPLQLLLSGLKAGLLTFGGAYTAIPFVQRDAVEVGGWLTNPQFLDGLALSGILPAPLIIFSTFVGYIAGGTFGALAMTVGVFFPAFSFTLIGHQYMERIIHNPAVHSFLDGVTAGVVGLIAATTIALFVQQITNVPALIIFSLALAALYLWKAKAAVAVIVVAAGLLGLLLYNATIG
jgi:chromate transporter